MGNMPDAVTVVLGPNDAFPSTLGNELQVQVVGHKHRTMPFPYGAAAFSLQAGTATLGDGQWTFGALSLLVANVSRPVGTRITSIQYGFNRGGSGNVTLKLRKRNIVTGAAASDVVSLAISAGTGWTTTTLDSSTVGSLLPYLTEAGVALWLSAQCDSASNVFGGGIVNADRL